MELGFISNPAEENYLISEAGKKNAATAIFTAFREYKTEYEANFGGSMPPPSVSSTAATNNNAEKPVYYVQIAASKKKVNPKSFKNITSVTEKYYNGNYIYLTANTLYPESAKKDLKSIKKKGYNDAFIVAFIGEKRITLQEAEALKP